MGRIWSLDRSLPMPAIDNNKSFFPIFPHALQKKTEEENREARQPVAWETKESNSTKHKNKY